MRIMHIALGGCLAAPPVSYGLTEDTGGHIAYILGAACAQAKRGDVTEVTIVTRAFQDDALGPRFWQREEQVGPALRILRLRTDNRDYLSKDALADELPRLGDAFLALLDDMRDARPDILHAHFADAAELAMAAERAFGLPWLYTAHSLAAEKLAPGETPGPTVSRRIAREAKAVRRAHGIIASSRDEAERQIPRIDPTAEGRCFRIGPGVSLRHDGSALRARDFMTPFLRAPEKPVILAIARPIEKKNLVALVEAYGQAPDLRERVNLVILAGLRGGMHGGPPEQDKVIGALFDAVDRHDLWGRVALPRHHDARDVADLYELAARGGVFCNPAHHEPFGLTLIEAAHYGVPIVATANGGPVDIVETLDAGELIDPASTASIADGLRRSLDDPHRVEKACKAAQYAKTHYNWIGWAARAGRISAQLLSPAASLQRQNQPDDFLLASDIDGTLTGCADGAAAFRAWVSQGDHLPCFAVATGRSVIEARRVLADWDLPEPDTIIASTGSEIWRRSGRDYHLCDRFAARIGADWRPLALREILGRLGATYQPRHDQRRWKISLLGAADDAARISAAFTRAGLRARVVASHARFVDILPVAAGKAEAIRFEAARRGLSPRDVVVAGDSGNDACMLGAFEHAILPANALPELDALKRGYRSPRSHAAGVLDGIAHFGLSAAPMMMAGE
ncbi:glycosyl transferase family 1 [Salipiger aestuarii]|nr:glycosyl transferase family 1 [Salipiger aestuarii]